MRLPCFTLIRYFCEKFFHLQPIEKILAFRKSFSLQDVVTIPRFGSKIAALPDLINIA